MSTGTLFDMQSQIPMFTGVPLVEELRPKRIADFIGLKGPKAVLTKFIASPRPCAFLFSGPSGCGKTTMGQALALELNATLWEVNSQRCNVAALEEVCYHMAYIPQSGVNGFHLCNVSEADLMSNAAENFLLSKLDSSGMMANVIWVFSGNDVDAKLSERFRSRTLRLDFSPYGSAGEVEAKLREAWDKKMPGIPAPAALKKAVSGNIRDAYQKLEVLMLEN
jgi:replication-associated recombination protein RarA